MAKILLVTLDFWPHAGGVAAHYLNLCRGIENDKIVVLTAKIPARHVSQGEVGRRKHKNTQNAECQKFDFSIFRKNLLWKFIWPRWLPLMWCVWRIGRAEKIEIIWVGEILPTGTAVYLLTRIFKRPFVVFCHGMDILQAAKSRRKKWLARRILAKAEGVTVNSRYTENLVKEFGIAEDKIEIKYPEADTSCLKTIRPDDCAKLRENYNLSHKKVLFSLSRLTKRKGFDMVIKSLSRVWEKLPDLVYVIAGAGDDRQRLERLADEVDKNGQKIIFLGQVSEHDKWLWLKTCDAFVMLPRTEPQNVEGFGIVFLEARAAGKPIIASKSGGAGEALADYDKVVFVDSGKTDEIVKAVLQLAPHSAVEP